MSRTTTLSVLALVGFVVVAFLLRSSGDPIEDREPHRGASDAAHEVAGARSVVPAEEPRDDPAGGPVRAVPSWSGPVLVVRAGDEALVGAEVALLPWGAAIEARVRSPMGIPWSDVGAAVERGVAGEQGRFELDAARLPFFVAARAPGHQPGGRFIDVGTTGEVVIECPPATSVRGRVVRADGRPVAGVHVRGRNGIFGAWLLGTRGLDETRITAMLFRADGVTDAEGRFALDALADGPAAVDVVEPSLSEEVGDVPVARDREVVIVVHEAAMVRGRVTDAATGEPIAGALVTTYFKRASYEESWVGWSATDAGGRYELRTRVAGQEFGLRVLSDGCASFNRRMTPLANGASLELDVALERGVAIAGGVTAPNGEPIAGAMVQAWDSKTGDWLALETTDGAGSFRLSGMKPEVEYLISIAHADFELLNESHVRGGTEREFVLLPLAKIRGRVRGDVARFVNGEARLSLEDDSGRRVRSFQSPVDEETGTFAFDRVTSGRHTLDVVVDDAPPARLSGIDVEAGDELLDVVVDLPPGVAIRGQVIDAETGAPIVGARVTLADVSTNGKVIGLSNRMASSGGDGSFVFGPADPKSRWTLVVEQDGYADGRFDHVPGDEDAVARVELKRAARVEVVIETSSVHADRSIQVDVTSPQQRESRTTVAGVPVVPILFEGLIPERASVIVTVSARDGPSLGRQAIERAVVLEPGRTTRVEFSLVGGGRVEGVLEGAGARIAEVDYIVISFASEVRGEAWTAYVAPDGTFEFTSLPAGRREFVLRERDTTRNHYVREVADVVEGGVIDVRLVLRPAGFAGAVRDANRAGVRGATIEFEPVDEAAPARPAIARTGEDGEYEIIGLAAGRYSALVRAPGFGTDIVYTAVKETDRPTRLDLTLGLAAKLAIDVTAGDEPLPGASILAEMARDYGLIFGPNLTDEHGRAIVAEIPADRYTVTVEAPGMFPRRIETAVGAGRAAEHAIDLVPRADLTVRSRSAGARVIDVTDVTTAESLSMWLSRGWVSTSTGGVETDPAGELRITGLPARTLGLAVNGGVPRAVTLAAGVETVVNLDD